MLIWANPTFSLSSMCPFASPSTSHIRFQPGKTLLKIPEYCLFFSRAIYTRLLLLVMQMRPKYLTSSSLTNRTHLSCLCIELDSNLANRTVLDALLSFQIHAPYPLKAILFHSLTKWERALLQLELYRLSRLQLLSLFFSD